MNTRLTWKSGMQFSGFSNEQHVKMDAKSPIGKGDGFTPKELFLAGIGGCSAMDIVGLLRKNKQDLRAFDIEVQADPVKGKHPAVFEKIFITYNLGGNVSAEEAISAVKLSQTQYCGVSAMVYQSVPIQYKIVLNGEVVGSGQADFSKQ